MDIFKNDVYKRPIIPLLFSYILGLVLGGHVFIPPFIIWVTVIACLSFTGYGIFRKQTQHLVPLILFIALGLLAMQTALVRENKPDYPVCFTEKGLCKIKGRLVTSPGMNHGRQTFSLDVSTIEAPGEQARKIQGNLRVTVHCNDLVVHKGDVIEFVSRIKPFRNFNNTDGYNYKRHMAFQDTWARAYGKRGTVRLLESGQTGFLDKARTALERFIDEYIKSSSQASVFKALLVGNRDQISPDLNDEFKQTGTAHLLAISGLHVGIVAGLFFLIFSFTLTWIPALLWHARVKTYAGILTLFPVLVYGLLAGMAPSTQRAVVMVTVILLTWGLGAEHDIINSLALAALAILAISPGALYGVSFQLSFAAVFFIILGMGCLGNEDSDILKSRAFLLKKSLKSYALVSLLAYMGTLPLLMHYFNQISVVGLVANMILVPLMGFMVVPLGLGAMFVYPFCSIAAGALIRLAGMFLGLALDLIHGFASLPYASVMTVSPSWFEMACYYLLFCLCLIFVSAKKKDQAGLMKGALILTGILALIFIGDIFYWTHARFFHADLRVTALDVGQGTSNLVEFPGGQCMLIDGGGFTDNNAFDVGERVVAPFLWSRKIACIDTVVLSHAESDHLNGLLYILKHFKVKAFWFNGIWKPSKSCDLLKSIVEKNNITVLSVKDFPDHWDMNGVRIQVLWPPDESEAGLAYMKDINNASLVLKLSYGEDSFLFTGDIKKKAEKAMVKRLGDELECKALIVPHHGSKSSSSDLFIEKVKPEIAVISAGYKNRFKMPHKAVLKRLTEQGIDIYRTDLGGAILMTTWGKGLSVDTVLTGH
ncbi:MAG: DNA internalization-related competence protein ComEC/Rec2 [Proteobacteria bacterium]|nr:DNA internalization-related competence protein ComEC/Rec2 [Pseudomonadota bacterium]